ncbi:MAG: hypothetical protein K6U09_06735 [Acidobacteriia bacterium]|jgi:hypothetical protein|nr:hypothetical protein [Terriglobia bacterium]
MKAKRPKPEMPSRRPRLSAEALERLVSEQLLQPLRASKQRLAIQQRCANSPREIEAALCTATVAEQLRLPLRAFVVEQIPRLMQRLFACAEAGESWAWRVILEASGLGEHFRQALTLTEATAPDAFVSIGFEQRLLERLRELGTSAPAATHSTAPADPEVA